MSLVSINDVLKITTKVEKIHPYKVVGDRDSYSPYNEGWSDCVSLIEHYLEQLPSAEPERKKGKWLPHPGDEDWDVCSVCGTGCKRRERGISQYIPWVTEYNYQFCPNCGAEMMRGEE